MHGRGSTDVWCKYYKRIMYTCTAARRDGALRPASRTTRHVEVVKKNLHRFVSEPINRFLLLLFIFFLLQQPVGCETPIRGVYI